MPKTKILLALAAVILLGAQVAVAQAPPAPSGNLENLTALAQVPTGSNEAQARDRAVSLALSQAVGRLAMQLLDPDTLRTRLDVLSSAILSRSSQFVTRYLLLAATHNQGTTSVLVNVSVDRASLLKALAISGLRLPAGSLPLTLALISEEAAPGRPPVYWWSGSGEEVAAAPPMVSEVLKSLGMRLVDPAGLVERVPPEARQPVLNEEQALSLASLAGAGLVLLGRVRTYPLVSQPGQSPPPLVQILALDVKDSKTLAVVEEEGPVFTTTPGPEASQAVQAAVQAAVRRLLEEVVGQSPAQAMESNQLVMEVEGVDSLADLHHFEEVLSGLSALVDQVHRESVGPGRATLRLALKVPAATLADQLLLQDYGSFLVNVVQSQPDLIKVVLIPKR